MTKLPYPKPAGDYVLVPTEPTIKMLNAYDEARAATTMVTNGVETYNPHQSYWAMLAVAQKTPLNQAAIKQDLYRAVSSERERCAKIAEEYHTILQDSPNFRVKTVGECIARVIRDGI